MTGLCIKTTPKRYSIGETYGHLKQKNACKLLDLAHQNPAPTEYIAQEGLPTIRA